MSYLAKKKKGLVKDMYILKRIEAMLKGWKNQPSKSNVNQLSKFYRKSVFNAETLEHLEQEDFVNLIRISHYADMGRSTAIQAAFCLGYEAGRGKEHTDNES